MNPRVEYVSARVRPKNINRKNVPVRVRPKNINRKNEKRLKTNIQKLASKKGWKKYETNIQKVANKKEVKMKKNPSKNRCEKSADFWACRRGEPEEPRVQ